jgi:hypothetical protein
MAAYAFFVIGNTFESIPEEDAPWDRSRRYRKTLKWTVYVDIVQGDENVQMEPPEGNRTTRWLFSMALLRVHTAYLRID